MPVRTTLRLVVKQWYGHPMIMGLNRQFKSNRHARADETGSSRFPDEGFGGVASGQANHGLVDQPHSPP
jgi:hypothetical protein